MDQQTLEKMGFTEFHHFATMDPLAPPMEFGAYVVLRFNLQLPEFLSESRGGRFKGIDRTVRPPENLAGSWVVGTPVLYIGGAGMRAGQSTHLRGRIDSYRKYGQGNPTSHAGGCRIWQLADSDDLVIAWKATPGVPGALLESDLRAIFKKDHGHRPFANGPLRKSALPVIGR